jgi:hypothetical protein
MATSFEIASKYLLGCGWALALLILTGDALANGTSADAFQGGNGGSARTTLAGNNWYVDGVNGSNHNDCKSPEDACKTIRHAIRLSAPGDSIIVAAAIYPENLTMPHSLNLVGAGAATTIIDGGGVGSVMITARFGVPVSVTVSNVTMRNGGGVGDGGNIYNCAYPARASLTISDSIIIRGHVRSGHGSDGYGGAIYNCARSRVRIINTTFSGNRSEVGGAICNGGSLTIKNSTFSGNTVRQDKAGAIANYGKAVIDNSTFSMNSSGSSGHGGAIQNGGILYHAPGTLTISNSTFSGNEAGDGGGIFNVKGSTAVLQNSIVANNTGGNCHGALTSNGYNLSSDDSCTFDGMGDLNHTDPRLGRLKRNGGPTPTMALLPGSPAIDSGNPIGCTDSHGHLLTTDQRGEPRPDKEDSGGCDRGAYERQEDDSARGR